MSTVGYIGLGDMGSAMAECYLATGRELVVHDINDNAVARVVERGGQPATSAADVAARCDVIEICVPAAHHVAAVMAELADAGRDGTVVLIHSTVHPESMVAARDHGAAWGARVFDVCVGGGVGNAREGDLVLFVGGLGDIPSAAADLFDIYGSKVVDAGPVGAGAAIKIGFNVMTYAQFAAARTGTGLVAEYGADPEALVDAWRHVGQLGVLTERALPLFSMTPDTVDELGMGDYMRGHVDIAAKDLELAREVTPSGSSLDGFLASIIDAMPTIYSVEDQ